MSQQAELKAAPALPGVGRLDMSERTAKLAAYLMYSYNIPLRNVVPHYHWPRRGQNPPNKNCPHFLMENGRPGRKWNWFLGRVNANFQRLQPPTPAARL